MVKDVQQATEVFLLIPGKDENHWNRMAMAAVTKTKGIRGRIKRFKSRVKSRHNLLQEKVR